MTISKSDFEIDADSDGSLSLNCGDGKYGESDLIFGCGYIGADPKIEDQRAILEYIMLAISKMEE